MIYVKSLLAGVAALIAYYFLFITVGMRLLLPMPPDLAEGAGYVSSSPWVPLWLILVIALLCLRESTFGRLENCRRQASGHASEGGFKARLRSFPRNRASAFTLPPHQSSRLSQQHPARPARNGHRPC